MSHVVRRSDSGNYRYALLPLILTDQLSISIDKFLEVSPTTDKWHAVTLKSLETIVLQYYLVLINQYGI